MTFRLHEHLMQIYMAFIYIRFAYGVFNRNSDRTLQLFLDLEVVVGLNRINNFKHILIPAKF